MGCVVFIVARMYQSAVWPNIILHLVYQVTRLRFLKASKNSMQTVTYIFPEEYVS